MTASERTTAVPGSAVRGHAVEGDRVTQDAKHSHRPRVWRVVRMPHFEGDKFLIMNSAGVCRESTLTGGWRYV